MGTQFWWFYDVLTVSITVGILYAAVQKGFNKTVFPLIGFLAAMAVGIYGSAFLKEKVYDSLFREKITATILSVLDNEEWDVLDATAEALSLSGEETDAETLHSLYEKAASGGEALPEWLTQGVCNTTEAAISVRQHSHAEHPLRETLSQAEVMTFLQTLYSGQPQIAAQQLEEVYYRVSYLELVRMAVFLLIELAMLIIYGIIATIGGDLDEQMHVRKGNHLLAFPAGVLEAACLLLIFTVAVQFVVRTTDGEMLLFNTETIGQTKLFRYLYQLI